MEVSRWEPRAFTWDVMVNTTIVGLALVSPTNNASWIEKPLRDVGKPYA